jgi:transposase
VLVPKLRPGDVVVMDNLSAHKSLAVREAIEAVGTEVLFLPLYAPDFNPNPINRDDVLPAVFPNWPSY